ncbi:MAG TPA: dihydrofolate reductase family protein [Solirubrobacterales bacterium]|nr:dihydrofolate reductase family protein [Solirubrobacterales bacterium]
MARLVYTAQTSLDGYVADEGGNFAWAKPDEEVHSFINELSRPIGTYLLGRRMYEVLRYWDDPPHLTEQPPHIKEYAEIWQATDKIVYSSTLDSAPDNPRTRIERQFDPAAVREMQESADADLSIGGPHLAAEALRAGLVDELHQFLYPVIVGGGTQWLPDGLRLDLELLEERRFAAGAVHLHYRT